MSASPYGAAHIKRQARWFAVAKAGIALTALAWQFVLVRYLGVADYASFTIFIAANGVLVFVTMFGMDRVVYRFVPPLRDAHRWREVGVLMGALLGLRLAVVALLVLGLWLTHEHVLNAQLLAEAKRLPGHYVAYAFATVCTESLALCINSLGQQGRQASLLMGSTVLRCALILAAALRGPLAVADVASIVVATEVGLAVALLWVLARELLGLRHAGATGGPLVFGFRWRTLVADGMSTQLTYMLGLPFRGTLLKLIVGAVSPPVVTAAFGFFQTMADRAYQFMPMFLMKGMLEPALAADYAQRRDFERIRLVVSMLLRLNFAIMGLGLGLLLGAGASVIDVVTNGRYGGQNLLACLILLQTAAMTLGEGLWIALNPIGRIGGHNRLWLWSALLCYGAVGLATARHSVLGLLVISVLPYLMVFGWLRWVSREPCLQGGLGLHRLPRLLVAIAAAACAARLGLWLAPAGVAGAALAVLTGAAAYAVVLRVSGLFGSAEVSTVGAISPRLARVLAFASR